MGISDIIIGHTNNLLGLNKDIAEARLKICVKCPLYKKTIAGPVCNSKLWYNKETGDVSIEQKSGYKKGCGCMINAKITVPTAQCPVDKW